MKWNEYFIVALCVCSTLLNGCSIIGLGIGIATSADEEVYNNESKDFPYIDSDDVIRVVTTDNDTIRGNLLGISKIPYEEYRQEYVEAIKELDDSVFLPNLGELLTYAQKKYHNPQRTLYTKTWKNKKFYGFGLGTIFVSDSNYDCSNQVRLSSISNLSMEEIEIFNIEEIEPLIKKGKIPLAPIIYVGNEETSHSIPQRNIKKVEIESMDKWWVVGLVIGALIDAYILDHIEFRKMRGQTGTYH